MWSSSGRKKHLEQNMKGNFYEALLLSQKIECVISKHYWSKRENGSSTSDSLYLFERIQDWVFGTNTILGLCCIEAYFHYPSWIASISDVSLTDLINMHYAIKNGCDHNIVLVKIGAFSEWQCKKFKLSYCFCQIYTDS